MALVCCSAQQSPELDVPVGISGDIVTARFPLLSPLCAGTRNEGSGCKTYWLGISAEPKIFPLPTSQNLHIVRLKMRSCSLVSKEGCCICFPFLWRNFPFLSHKPTPFVACITICMKHQSQILRTLGVIFTAGAEPSQCIGIINTMSSLYRTRAKLLLIATLEDPNSPHLSLQI